MATTTLPLLEGLPATKVARAAAQVVLLVVATKEEVAPALGVRAPDRAQVRDRARVLRPALVLGPQPAEVLKAMALDPKVATAMAHLEMDHQDQALETPPAMAANRAITTTIPQTTVAQAALELEVLVVTKAEAAPDLLVHLKTLEALPMVTRTTTMTRSKVVLKEATV